MSIRFDSSNDRLHYSAVAPPSTFTITCWVYLSVDTNSFSCWLRLWDSGASTVATWATDSNGTSGPNYYTASGSINNATGLVVGEWRKVAITRTGTSGQVLVATPSGSTEVDSGTVSGATPAGLTIGNRHSADGSEPWNGRVAQVRIWDNVLTQAQIEAEWASSTPVVTSGLWENWPLATATDLTGTVNSRVLTVHGGGALTTEDGPPNAGTTGTLQGDLPILGGSLAGNVVNPAVIAGALPTLAGSLTADLRNSGVIAGALPTLNGQVTGEVLNSGVIANALPTLGGQLIAEVKNAAVITGDLPTLAGQLSAVSFNPGLVVGALPTLGGGLQAVIRNPAVIAGALPMLGGSLSGTVSGSGIINAVIGGALPMLRGSLPIALGPTMNQGIRSYIYSLITGDALMNELGITADTTYLQHSRDTQQARPFMVLRWGNTAAGIVTSAQGAGIRDFPVNQRTLQVWVHVSIRDGDYAIVDQALIRLRTLLRGVTGVRVGPGDAWLQEINWEGDSNDLRDDEAGTLNRNAQFRLTGSAL